MIAVCPDGWAWSVAERTNQDWRIVKFAALTVSEASVFLSPETDIDPRQPSRTLQRRAFKFDVDSLLLASALRTFIADTTRGTQTFRSTMSKTEVDAVKVRRLPIIDPMVIGESRNIF